MPGKDLPFGRCFELCSARLARLSNPHADPDGMLVPETGTSFGKTPLVPMPPAHLSAALEHLVPKRQNNCKTGLDVGTVPAAFPPGSIGGGIEKFCSRRRESLK